MTPPHVLLSDPAWMSPEQRRGGDVDQRSDLHALGIALFTMLAHWLPVANAAPSTRSALEAVVCLRLLADDPAARYGDATQLLAAPRDVTP